jgi:hypothetical protein
VTDSALARPGAQPDRWRRRLVVAGWCFAAGTAVHVIDHLRRGQGSVTEELYWLGNVALVVQVATITLVLTGHRFAPFAGAGAGIVLAVGFGAAHWLPEWSVLSDPVWQIGDARWFSYLASSAEIGGALAVGAASIAVLRRTAGR